MADRSVAITLKANVQGLVAGFKTAQTAAEDFAAKGLDKIGKNTQHINTLSNQVGGLGLALVGVAALAVKSFADFDQAMSNVAATGDDARGSITALRDAAIDAGARTAFSATEAAGAIEELAKAGVSAEDILGGGLDGALDLAAAGGLDVADAAGIAAVALQQFGLEGRDMTHVSDLLAAGAGKAMGSVDDMGAALKQSGLVADQTGLSIEETTAALAAFASAGLLGSDAGTSLKTMLQRLTPQSEEAAKQFDALGISAYDAEGNFVGLENFAGQLQDRMKDLTPEARNAALAVMFGSDAVRGASVLYEEGAAGIQEWTAAVDDQGYAAEVAATRLDNLKGDVEQLTGALETAFIQAGSGGNDMLRGLTQGLTDVVNGFNDLPSPIQNATLLLTGGAGLVALGVAGMGKLVVGVSDARDAMKNLGLSAKAAGGLVAGVGTALTIATVGLTIWATENAKAAAKVEELASSLDETSGAITKNTREIVKNDLAAKEGWWLFSDQYSANSAAKILGIDLDTLTDAAMGNADAMKAVDDVLHPVNQNIRDTADAAEAAGVKLGDYTAAQLIVEDAVKGNNQSLEDAIEIAHQKQEADAGQVDAQEGVADAYAATTEAVEEQIGSLEDLVKAQADAAGVVLSVRDAQVQMEAAVDGVADALEAQVADLTEQHKAAGMSEDAARALAEAEVAASDKLDITTEAGRNNRGALDEVAQAGWDLIKSMEANDATQEDLQGTMADSRQKFLDAAGAMGLGADEANRLADEMGLIPENLNIQVRADTQDALVKLTGLRTIYDALQNKTITVAVNDRVAVSAAARTGQVIATNADGGYIAGPGSGTSDSILSWLSNGEYVVKASAVQRYGRGFFDTVNAERFATGGFVGGQPAAPVGGPTRHTELHVHNEGKRDVTTQDIVFAQARLDALAPSW